MASNSQELPVMHRFRLTWGLNSLVETILNPLDMFWCTFYGEYCPGKILKPTQRSKSTNWSWRRNCPHHWIYCAKITFLKCKHLSVTHETWSSNKPQTTITCEAFLSEPEKDWPFNSTTNTTGQQNDIFL